MDTELLNWIATYITLATILFNVLRYLVRLYLPSSLILSVSASFLMLRFTISEAVGRFLAENTWPLSILAILITIIVMLHNSKEKTDTPTGKTTYQRKKWTVIFRIRRG